MVASLVSDATLARRLQQIGPLSAGLDVQATMGVKALPLTPWQGLGVVALWTCACRDIVHTSDQHSCRRCCVGGLRSQAD